MCKFVQPFLLKSAKFIHNCFSSFEYCCVLGWFSHAGVVCLKCWYFNEKARSSKSFKSTVYRPSIITQIKQERKEISKETRQHILAEESIKVAKKVLNQNQLETTNER